MQEKQSWQKQSGEKGNRVVGRETELGGGKQSEELPLKRSCKVAGKTVQELCVTSWNVVLQFLCYKLRVLEMLEQCQLS